MRRLTASSSMLVLAVVAAPAAPAQSGRPLDHRLDSIARAFLARDGAVGGVVAVVRGDDTLLFRSYGRADAEADVPMTTHAVFGIGSITKQFTAAAILQLRDAGTLRLDDDVTRWLPDFDTDGHRVTLRRLLEHTSGIHDLTGSGEFGELVRNTAFPRDSMYVRIARHPSQFPPGAALVYNNSAYWLLHLVIEKASGMSYRAYVERHLLAPLGMRASGFCLDGPSVPGRAQGYRVRDGRVRRAPPNVSTWYLGSGALCSTAGDLATWLRALHGGRVLPRASYDELIRPARLGDGTPTRYALGLEVRHDTHGLHYIGHGGEITGYAARANWYPDAELAVVVLMNNSGDASPSAMAEAVAAEVLPAHRQLPRPFTGDATPLVGAYRGPARGGDMVAVVRRTPEGLAVSVSGAPERPLTWVEGRTFRAGGALLTFRRADDGAGPMTELRFDAGNGYYVLGRLTRSAALLAQARLLAARRWPPAVGGLTAAALCLLAYRRRRRAGALSQGRFRMVGQVALTERTTDAAGIGAAAHHDTTPRTS